MQQTQGVWHLCNKDQPIIYLKNGGMEKYWPGYRMADSARWNRMKKQNMWNQIIMIYCYEKTDAIHYSDCNSFIDD